MKAKLLNDRRMYEGLKFGKTYDVEEIREDLQMIKINNKWFAKFRFKILK